MRINYVNYYSDAGALSEQMQLLHPIGSLSSCWMCTDNTVSWDKSANSSSDGEKNVIIGIWIAVGVCFICVILSLIAIIGGIVIIMYQKTKKRVSMV